MSAAREPLLFVQRARDLLRAPAVTCTPTTTATDLARVMSADASGAVIVLTADGAPHGIVTDRDLRTKLVAAGRDPRTTTAAELMSSPVVTIAAETFAFEALVEMTRRSIHHLPVVEHGRLAGVLSSDDALAVHAAHPVIITRQIARAASVSALAALAPRVIELARRLVQQGASAYDVGQLIAELNDRTVVRVLELSEAAAGPPPAPYAWLAFGSEARREQTLRTDQDNGLVYDDAAGDGAGAYFARLATAVVDALITVGFPPCPGGAMASNQRWCQPRAVWLGYFREWLRDPTPGHVLAACMYFDLRAVGGTPAVADALGAVVREEAPGAAHFLGRLARDVVDRGVPTTLFGSVAVARRGPHRGTVDVKGAGSMQLVGAARVHALALGLTEVNTVDRFRAAGARGVYTPEMTREITDAQQHLLRLRLIHQLEQVAAGAAPDNHVDPARLAHRDAVLLRDALKTVTRVQGGLRERYATDFIPG